jgi:hypothetical protein
MASVCLTVSSIKCSSPTSNLMIFLPPFPASSNVEIEDAGEHEWIVMVTNTGAIMEYECPGGVLCRVDGAGTCDAASTVPSGSLQSEMCLPNPRKTRKTSRWMWTTRNHCLCKHTSHRCCQTPRFLLNYSGIQIHDAARIFNTFPSLAFYRVS